MFSKIFIILKRARAHARSVKCKLNPYILNLLILYTIPNLSINTRDINQFTYVLNLSISKHINQFTYVLDLSISKQDINPFTYTDIILQHYKVPLFYILYLTCSLYVRTHNVTTDTNKWRAKGQIALTRKDIHLSICVRYIMSGIYITRKHVHIMYPQKLELETRNDITHFSRISSLPKYAGNKKNKGKYILILKTFIPDMYRKQLGINTDKISRISGKLNAQIYTYSANHLSIRIYSASSCLLYTSPSPRDS